MIEYDAYMRSVKSSFFGYPSSVIEIQAFLRTLVISGNSPCSAIPVINLLASSEWSSTFSASCLYDLLKARRFRVIDVLGYRAVLDALYGLVNNEQGN